jgi:hypothetical protein
VVLPKGDGIIPLEEPKKDGLFHWSCPREMSYSLGRVQGRKVILLLEPEGRGSFSWPCPREKGLFLGQTQEKRSFS